MLRSLAALAAFALASISSTASAQTAPDLLWSDIVRNVTLARATEQTWSWAPPAGNGNYLLIARINYRLASGPAVASADARIRCELFAEGGGGSNDAATDVVTPDQITGTGVVRARGVEGNMTLVATTFVGSSFSVRCRNTSNGTGGTVIVDRIQATATRGGQLRMLPAAPAATP